MEGRDVTVHFLLRPWSIEMNLCRSSMLWMIVLVVVVSGTIWAVQERASRRGRPRPAAPRGELSVEEKSTIEIFRRSAPSVVYITTKARRINSWTRIATEIPSGTGSGFVWDRQGHIVTNFHVIDGASSAQVTLSDHRSFDAKLVGTAPGFDLVVLKIDGPHGVLPPVDIGSSADLEVGQKVFAIGNPFGLDQTLTTGVVSALGRTIKAVTGRPIEGVVQTDADINPGNSGGPLLDSAGRLIGVNTAILSPSGGNAGIGFAVPVDTVNRIVPQLIEYGQIVRPQLGVQLVPEHLNLVVTRRLNVEGVLIAEVVPGSGAAEAGLKGSEFGQRSIAPGDIIVAIEDKAVTTRFDLLVILEEHEPGETLKLKIWRENDIIEKRVRLQGLVRD